MSWPCRIATAAGCALTVVACGGSALEPTSRQSALALTSAQVRRPAQPASSTPTPTPILSCAGSSFCRESIVADGSPDAIEELIADCTRLEGTNQRGACSRQRVVASCAVESGEHGPVKVFAYAHGDGVRQTRNVTTVSELCEQFEGVFEIAER